MSKRKSVEQQVSELKERTSDLASIYKLMVGVQKDDLAKAEKLRQLAMAVTRRPTVARRGHQAPHDGYLVGRNVLESLAAFVNKLTTPFYREPGKRERERLARALRRIG